MGDPTAPAFTTDGVRGATRRFDLRDRAAAANQFAVVRDRRGDVRGRARDGVFNAPRLLFALGALDIGLGGIAALAVPWTAHSVGWVAVVPIVDIFAIALRAWPTRRRARCCWIFPAMWLASLGRADDNGAGAS